MNILMVYQSIIDMCASFLMMIFALVTVNGVEMSRRSSYDQFVCHFWITGQPLAYFITTSTYGILLTAMDRYLAVLRPIWYNGHVRITVLSS